MTYNIAGLIVEISGNCELNKSDVTYVKHPETGVYVRGNALGCCKQNTSAEENFSSAEGSVSFEETEQISPTDNTLTAVMQGCESNKDGEALYILKRLSEYKAGVTQEALMPDFRIKYKILPEIGKSKGEYIGYLSGFHCYMSDEAVYMEKRIDLIDDILAKISIDHGFKSAEVELIDVAGLGGLSLNERLHSYLGEAFACLALSTGRMVFHSSAINHNGQGICFSAPSGTGKSTHTGLWMKNYCENTEIINDDTPVIYLKNGKPMLCGTPWSGKTALNINKEIPLKGIVFLTRSKENYIEPIKGLNAVKKFYGESKVLKISSLVNKSIEVISGILENISVYVLGCNISKDAVDLVKNTLGL